MFGIFTEAPAGGFIAENDDLKRKSWQSIGMIRVSDTLKPPSKHTVTLGHVQVIRGHGVKWLILVILGHDTCI